MAQFRERLHLEQLDWPDADRPHVRSNVETITDQNFERTKVLVDNRHFRKCRFESCVFVHSGGPFAFEECEIVDHTVFDPTGGARRTMRLHDALKLGFGKGLGP
jgi:hypothetical protein